MKLAILDACNALGRACGFVGDSDDTRRYYKRAKEGFEEQLGRDSEKALEVKGNLIIVTGSKREKTVKLGDLVKRMERALGEEHVVTLETLNSLGNRHDESGEYEEAKEVHERRVVRRMKVLREDHKQTLVTLNNLGAVYYNLRNYEKALEYYERALQGNERMLGNTHPETLRNVMNIANLFF